ncbi:MAG: MarR family transcriptional regulator [Myxococcales bacterium]|nr:MarR family transcriptional regulator [Myxococcales bacterium]
MTDAAGTPHSYADVRDEFAAGMARICGIYGMNPLYGRMYGALYLTPRPMALGEVAEMLGTAKSTASVGLRQLEAFGLVRRSRKLRDRRDFYEAETDGRAIAMGFVRNYMEREMEEGLRMTARLKEGMKSAGSAGWPVGVDLEIVQGRAEFIVDKMVFAEALFAQMRRVLSLSHSGHELLGRFQKLLRGPT